MRHRAPELIEFEPSWLDELIAMWRASFEQGVGISDPHPLEEQKQYFLTEVLPLHEVRLAVLDKRLVGFVAASKTVLAQLYVRTSCQRQGVGSHMLAWAKAQSSGSLSLYTFARNEGACAFYERNGFVAVKRGVEGTWQLEDVQYRWSAERGSVQTEQ